MATITTVNPADFANRQQTLFNRKLYDSVKQNLVLADYGMPWSFEENRGTYTMRWFRPREANTTGINTITPGAAEITTPTTKTEVAVGYGELSLVLQAQLSEISNLVRAIDIFNTVSLHIDKLGEDAALNYDTVIRNALIARFVGADITNSAVNASRDKFVRFAGVDNSPSQGTASARFATFAGLQPSASKLTRAANLGMVTYLAHKKVPMNKGKYVAAIPPTIWGDVTQDTTVVSGLVYDSGKLWKGFQGELDGVMMVRHTNPHVMDATYSATSADPATAADPKFGVLYFGRDSFICPRLTDGKLGYSDPRTPKVTVLSQPDKTDPNNLKTVLATKFWFNAEMLLTNETTDVPWAGLLMARSVALAN